MAALDSFQASEMKDANPCEGREDEEDVQESEGDEEEGRGEVSELRRCDGEVTSTVPFVEAETRKSHLQSPVKITARQFSANGQSDGFLSKCSSQLCKRTEFEERVALKNSEVPVTLTAQVTQGQLLNQIQLSSCSTPSSDFSPTSVMQSVPSPMLEKIILSRVTNGECMPESNWKNSSSLKSTSVPLLKASASDGFNWRKYGQKQVKSPRGFRSYYRCTYSECYAKKIECCDHSGHVAEIVYKSQHNHDPPRKIGSMRKSKLLTSADHRVRDIENSRTVESLDLSRSLKEPVQEKSVSGSESKRQNSICYTNGNGQLVIKEENVNELEPKRRVKKSNIEHSDSLFKTGKKQKIVVHAADVGISGDGYRWRKYGQKMVKGNPHPRNYYRCTSAGCPVRKHTETDVENPSTVIITYKGVHDHDMPVLKKRHDPPSAQLVAASAAASMNTMQAKKAKKLHNHMSSMQLSVAAEGELNGEALDLGGEKAMESARTLLSMGFEIKPC